MAESKINAPGTLAGVSTSEEDALPRSTVDVLRAGREQAFEEAKTKMREAADDQRRRAADAVGGVAGALHRVASDVKAENETMGRYTNMAAERLDDMSRYLRDTDWNDVVQGAEDFARRQPYWFVGGAMAAGFVLARFVKNSGEASRRAETAARLGQRMAAGYGTSTEAGLYPPATGATAPISSPGAAAPISSPGAAAPISSAGAAGTTAPGREV